MESISVPQIATYISYLFVIVAYAIKIRKVAKMPLHLRWEIYPVATEGGGKAKYGGSYFEETEYWKKSHQKSHLNGIWEMAKKYLTMWGYYRRP